MDTSFTPPENVVDVLKCTLCESYLSVAPIYLISDDGSQYKCGRCSNIKTIISIRLSLFEQITKLMTFPCSYKECSKKISFNEVKEHEKTCIHRTITCPKANCYESYKIWTIAAHFKEKHGELFHSNIFDIKNVYAYYNIDVMERNGKTYISLFDFDDLNIGMSVCSLDGTNESNTQYEIKLSSENSKFAINVSNQNIISFNEREHCFKCVSGNCKTKFHVYKDNRKEVSKRMTTKINRDSVKKMFGPGLITYTINIIDKVEVKEEVKEKNETKEDVKDLLIKKAKKIFLQMLECPVCKEYMSPPIYQCLSGHTICTTCKAKIEKCGTCDAKIESTRNYTLEDLSKKVELPQFEEKKSTKNDGGVKRNAADEDAKGNGEVPSKVPKK